MDEHLPRDVGQGEIVSPDGRPLSGSPSGYAIAAFVLGILSFAMCGPCAGIPALILGLIELQNIKSMRAPPQGKPFALIGAILGGVNFALVVLLILFYLIIMLIAVLGQGIVE